MNNVRDKLGLSSAGDFAAKIVNTKADRCPVNGATSRKLQEANLIDENSIDQYCSTHPLFEISSAIDKVFADYEKKHLDYEKNSTLFSKRGDGDFLTLLKSITKLFVSDPHASLIVAHLKSKGITNIVSKWGRNVGDRLCQTYSRCETLLACQNEILEAIERRVKPSQRNIVASGAQNNMQGSLVGGVELGLKSQTTTDMAIAGAVINQSVMEPLRAISAKDFFTHATEIHEGIEKMTPLIDHTRLMKNFLTNIEPIFGSKETQQIQKKTRPTQFIDSTNEEFISTVVQAAFVAVKKKLESQLKEESAGNFTRENLKAELLKTSCLLYTSDAADE